MRKKLDTLSARLDDLKNRRIMRSPGAYLDVKRLELDRASAGLISAGERQNAARRREYVKLAASLDAMSPLKVLSRGYAIAEDAGGRVLRSVSQTASGEEIRVELTDGSLDCRVEMIKERNNG